MHGAGKKTKEKNFIIYIITQNILIMFPLTGQTAGPIGLKFVVDTQGWLGGDIG